MWTNRGTVVRSGREYLRVSFDRSGRERSQDEQHGENERACSERGIRLEAPYRESGSRSASRYARKARDDFARLIEDLESGRFGADVLVLWESGRGSRQVGEWVRLIELCEQRDVTIFVTTHAREYDPRNARDRRSLLEDAVDAEYESSKTSERVRRAAAANAAAGRPHGRVPFGYVRRYDERTRQLIAQEPHPSEAPLIQELVERIKSGHSLNSIARDWAARGVTTRTGRTFDPSYLRQLALTATYAGIRVHDTQSRTSGKRLRHLQPGVQQVPATWPALVSKTDFLAVQEILTDPRRRTSRPGKAKHLLSLIARCDVCEASLTITFRAIDEGEYQCRAGHVRARKAELETLAEKAIFNYLSRPDVFAELAAGDEPSAELAAVRDDLAQARTELRNLRAAVGARQLSVQSLVEAEPGLLASIAELEAREQELTTPSILRGLITPGARVREHWATMPIAARREVAKLLLTPDKVGQLRVARIGSRGPTRIPTVERVCWRRTTPSAGT